MVGRDRIGKRPQFSNKDLLGIRRIHSTLFEISLINSVGAGLFRHCAYYLSIFSVILQFDCRWHKKRTPVSDRVELRSWTRSGPLENLDRNEFTGGRKDCRRFRQRKRFGGLFWRKDLKSTRLNSSHG